MDYQTDIPSGYYRISLKVIIRNEKNEVLVNREAGRAEWGLPGGGWDHGETVVECIKRELFEELGYEGNITARQVGVTDVPMWMPTKKGWLLWMVYEVTPDTLEFEAGHGSDEVKFVDPAIFKDSTKIGEKLIYKFGII